MKKATESAFVYEEPTLTVVEIETKDVVTTSTFEEVTDPDQAPWIPVE